MDKIFDFFRMVLRNETKGQALAKLNEFMHENHLVINNCVINALREAKHLQVNEVDDEFENQQVVLIKENLNSIKQSMINQMYQPQNDSKKETTCVDHVINHIRDRPQIFTGKEADIESTRVEETIFNINKLREHCQRSLEA